MAGYPGRNLVQPAIDLALNGFVLTAREAENLNSLQEDLKKFNSIQPDFLIRDAWNAGDTIFYEDLGHTLERIRDNGMAGFYAGKTADDIVAEMRRGNWIDHARRFKIIQSCMAQSAHVSL